MILGELAAKLLMGWGRYRGVSLRILTKKSVSWINDTLFFLFCLITSSLSVCDISEEIEWGIPILPDWLSAQFLQSRIDYLGGTLIAHGELLQRLRIGMITARIYLWFCRHGGDTQCCHVVTDVGWLTGRVGDIYIVVEDTHGESSLCQLLIGHEAVWLETFVLCRRYNSDKRSSLKINIF